MKSSKKMTCISLALVALFSSAYASASVEDSLSNICNIVKSNDKSELRKKMKTVRSNFKLRLNDYYDGISCDGVSLIKTALLSDAVDTGTLLVKKLPKSRLASADADGMPLTAWIQSKGLDASPIASAINERL